MSDSSPTTVPTRYRRAFGVARRAAEFAVRRRTRLLKLVRDAYAKLDGQDSVAGRLHQDVRLLGRLVRAYAKKEYRAIPWRSLVYASAALIYFIAPVDAIPDALFMIGFVDDLAVISAVVKALHGDLRLFEDWESRAKALEGSAAATPMLEEAEIAALPLPEVYLPAAQAEA